MAATQIAISETIHALKLALRRQRAQSPSELSSGEDDADDLHTTTNRGNKLKPSAQYAHTGRLDTTGGTKRYKRKVNHAGHERFVINKKPKLYDEDGDVVDPLDLPSDIEEGDERLYGEPLEEDAFGDVRLEELLRPLTSAAELAEHPGYKEAYTSRALTEMAQQAAEMVRRERASLWKAKRLLERFRGDGGWMECQRFEMEQDIQLLNGEGEREDAMAGDESAVPSIVETDASLAGLERVPAFLEREGGIAQQPAPVEEMDGVETQDHIATTSAASQQESEQAEPAADGQQAVTNGHTAPTDPQPKTEEDAQAANPAIIDLAKQRDEEEEGSTSNSNPSAPSHAMTTRARARSPQLPASPSPSPSDSASIPTMHPWFNIPNAALPDKDLNLPPAEAEDTRKLLLLYVQKQENIVRQLEMLYFGLQRGDRLRQEVYRAAKAEGHMRDDGKGGFVTEMSDGEDWYDPADWDLKAWELNAEGRLEKGKDEVEDAAEEEGRRVGGRRRRVVGR